MNLEPITLDGKTGTVAYLNDALELVEKDKATFAKVVFDDGTRTFYRVTRG